MTVREITLQCDHVSKGQVHCNRYKNVRVDDENKTVSTIVNESSWEYDPETGKTYCEEHQ